jgi:hypothetical protein
VTGSPFHFKPDGYISKLLAPSIPLTMPSRRDVLSAQRSRRASKQRDRGTLRSLVYSAAVRSDPSQESGLEVLRKKDHDNSGEAHAFHSFKRAVRIESLNRETGLSQQKRHAHIPSSILSEANLTYRVTESPASATIKGSKATPRSDRLSESHTDRATSKTSSTITLSQSKGSQWYQRSSEEPY